MSTMETPPPDAQTPVQPGPPERRCPRCGSALSPDQEWCLNCGAAAGTEVVEPKGWRVPLYLGAALIALAAIGVVLAIVALSSRNEELAQTPTPTPPAAETPGATPTAPLATTTPYPSATVDPNATPSPDPNASPTVDPSLSPEPSPTTDPGTTDEGSGSTDDGSGSTDDGSSNSGSGNAPSSTFPGWTGADGDYTIIIASNTTLSSAEKVAQKAQDAGEDVGILNSDDYSSLNGGYYVVFTGTYSSKSEANNALSGVRANHKGAYVRQIKT